MAKRLKTRLDAGQPRDAAVLERCARKPTETAAVRFEGNGYSEEWMIGRRAAAANILTPPARSGDGEARAAWFPVGARRPVGLELNSPSTWRWSAT
jgi:hypothetical protein